MKIVIAVLALLILPISAFAQIHSTAKSSEMRKLDFLLGAWEGDGWVEFGPGQRQKARVRESAQSKAGGAVLLLEGLGKAKLPGNDEETIVHNAFAVIWYDGEAKRFRMTAFRATGDSVDADIVVGDKSLVWGFRDPRAGQIRFTLKLDEAGRWFEIGETSRKGAEWRKFFEMTLQRVK